MHLTPDDRKTRKVWMIDAAAWVVMALDKQSVKATLAGISLDHLDVVTQMREQPLGEMIGSILEKWDEAVMVRIISEDDGVHIHVDYCFDTVP